MMEKWNQFVYDLCEARKGNVDENEYHRLIEIQLQLLGWAKYRGEICHKPNIPIGNNNFIQPDILIKDGNRDLFVIEVKRPVHIVTARERQQLESYMRQCKIKVGIYIGEHIELLYDKPDMTNAVSVMVLPLELDNKLGAQFVKLFSKEGFSHNALYDYCEKRVEEIRKKEKVEKIKKEVIANAHDIIHIQFEKYLKEKYTFSDEDAKSVLDSLIIRVTLKQDVKELPLSQGIQEVSSNKPSGSPSKYSLDGSQYIAANRFVLAVVKSYVSQHPELTFSELKEIFPQELQGSSGVIQSLDYLKIKNYKGQRFFQDERSILTSADGIKFAVCTQWSYHNTPNFAARARELGFIVENT